MNILGVTGGQKGMFARGCCFAWKLVNMVQFILRPQATLEEERVKLLFVQRGHR